MTYKDISVNKKVGECMPGLLAGKDVLEWLVNSILLEKFYSTRFYSIKREDIGAEFFLGTYSWKHTL